VNADGYADVVIGDPVYSHGQQDEGRALAFLGSSAGLSTSPAWSDESNATDADFGHSVASAGDVNADGYGDIIVGAHQHPPTYRGRAYLYLGSVAGLGSDPAWIANGGKTYAAFGYCVASAGDFDGNGYGDVIVGAVADATSDHRSLAALYSGSSAGLSSVPTWMAVGQSAAGGSESSWFGGSVGTVGDLNGDGYSNITIGEPAYSTIPYAREGRAYVYQGAGGLGSAYCAANPNSTGAPADLIAWRSASASEGLLRLLAGPVPYQFGIFFHGMNQTQVPFGNGFLCAAGDLVRGAVTHGEMNTALYTYDNSDAAHSVSAYVGTTRNFQYWFRDPGGGGAFFNTSNAVSIAILP
jgi:hypothetical protein